MSLTLVEYMHVLGTHTIAVLPFEEDSPVIPISQIRKHVF